MLPKDHTKLTLGELLGVLDPTIRRNAMSILKQLQRLKDLPIKRTKNNIATLPSIAVDSKESTT